MTKSYDSPDDYYVDPQDGTVFAIDDMGKKQLREAVRTLQSALTDDEHALMAIQEVLNGHYGGGDEGSFVVEWPLDD